MKRHNPFSWRLIGSIATVFLLSISFTSYTLYGHTNEGTAEVHGVVTDKEIGEPLVGATVVIKNTSLGSVTDLDGRYSISKLEEGQYTFEVKFVGYETISRKVVLKRDDKQMVNFAMSTGIKLQEIVVVEELSDVELSYSPAVVQGISRSVHKIQRGRSKDAKSSESSYFSPPPLGQGAIADTLDYNTEAYDHIVENPFKEVMPNPLSTFSIDVDAASYSNIRRFIDYGQSPPKDAVRIEELVNYFTYEYPQPVDGHPFSINTEISETPWNDTTKLIHIGLQGKQIDYENIEQSNLVFLIDVSGSMQSPNKLGLVKSSLYKLVDQLGAGDRVAIVVYAGAAGEVLPSTLGSDKQKIKSAISNLRAGGSTAGGAGIKLAYKIAMDNLVKGNNRVILCTDGDFNVGASSDAEMVRLIEEKRESGIYITVCGFGMGNYKDSKMEKIADHGNGNYFYIDREKEADKVFVTEMRSTLFTIAKDVKLQIEFNPVKVKSYRLIGYENRILAKEDFNDDTKDAGELGAGHTVTALYEVVLLEGSERGSKGDQGQGARTQGQLKVDELRYQKTAVKSEAYRTDEILTLKLRYKLPDETESRLIEHPLSDSQVPLTLSSDNFRWSAAVASWGMILRDSEYQGKTSIKKVQQLAEGAIGPDLEGYRADFIEMVKASSKVYAKSN